MGAALSRDHLISRLEAAPTTHTTCSFLITGFNSKIAINCGGNMERSCNNYGDLSVAGKGTEPAGFCLNFKVFDSILQISSFLCNNKHLFT